MPALSVSQVWRQLEVRRVAERADQVPLIARKATTAAIPQTAAAPIAPQNRIGRLDPLPSITYDTVQDGVFHQRPSERNRFHE